MPTKKRDEKLIQLVIDLYARLGSVQKVAKRAELGSSTVHRMLRSAGVELPGVGSDEWRSKRKALHGDVASEAARDYAEGMSISSLRKKYGVSAWAIRTAAKDYGVEPRKRGGRFRLFSEREQKEMEVLYSQRGWTQGQIALKFGSSTSKINRILRERGVSVRSHRATRESHGSWNGGRVQLHGYIAVLLPIDDPLHVMAHRGGYVLEHRLVMARAIGRPLSKNETVHHLDGDKTNNDLSNLQLRFGKHGNGVALKCRCCGSTDIIPVEL